MDSSEPGSDTYRGPRPGSEPETQAVMSFLSRRRPAAAFSFHALAGICGSHFLGPSCAKDDDKFVRSAGELAQPYGVGMRNPFNLAAGMSFGSTSGSLAAWCCRELKVPALDLEMPQEEPALSICRSDRTDGPLLNEYRRRHVRGVRRVLERLRCEAR